MLNRKSPKHQSDSCKVFLNGLPMSHMRHVEYLCGFLCCVIWIISNQRYDLVIVNDCRPPGTFWVLQINTSISDLSYPLTDSSLSYSTISINGTYLFILLFMQYIFLSRKYWVSNNEKASYFPPYSLLTEKQSKFTIHTWIV